MLVQQTYQIGCVIYRQKRNSRNLTYFDCGGGVGVSDVGRADLLAGEAAVAHVGHQSAVGGVDIRAEAVKVGRFSSKNIPKGDF